MPEPARFPSSPTTPGIARNRGTKLPTISISRRSTARSRIQAVVDLRRGVDLLLGRSDVDPRRLAYVGHSYGAQWGSILSAVDRRMKTSVLMAGVAEMADILLRSDDPGMVDFRKTQPAGQLEKYSQVTGDIDSISWERRRPFLCCSNLRITSSTSTRLRGSIMWLPRAIRRGGDFRAWLVKFINLRREPVLTH